MSENKVIWRDVKRERNEGFAIFGSLILMLITLSSLTSMVSKADPGPVAYVDGDEERECWGNTPCWPIVQMGVDDVDPGGTVYIYDGTYLDNVLIDKDVDIIGLNGSEVTIVGKTWGNGPTFDIGENLQVSISGLSIQGVFSGTYYGIKCSSETNLVVSNNVFKDLLYGIYMTNGYLYADSNRFNVTTLQYAYQPVSIYLIGGSTDSVIVNNTFDYHERNGLAIRVDRTAIRLIANNTFNQGSEYSGPGYGENSGNIGMSNMGLTTGRTLVRNNTITNGYWGIMTEGTNATVENNTLSGCRRCISSAAWMTAPQEHMKYPSNLTVANNTITSFIEYGLQVTNKWSYMKAVNNNITGLGTAFGQGVHVGGEGRLEFGPNNTISNVYIGVKTYYGSFTNASENVIYNTGEGFHSEGRDNIHHNEFYSNDEGVRVQADSTRNVSNNTIAGSSVRAGIWIYHSSGNNKIQNNEISQGYRGVWIWGASSNNNLIRWNNISDNYYGIHIEPYGPVSPTFNTVEGNNITMNDYGIYVRESDSNVFRDNNISGNRNTGIYLDSVDYVTIEHSNISNNFKGIVLTEEELPPSSQFLTIMSNSILGNTLWAINSSLQGSVDAMDNFFGVWNNDTIEEMISGNINYYPWLAYRESNVDIVDFMQIIPPISSPYYVDRGMIVNGSLLIGPSAEVIFNNSLGQNFIQVNGVMNAVVGSTFSSNFGNFTLIYLNGSSGIISGSSIEGQMGVSIQSSGISVSDSSLLNGTAGIIINQGENNLISGCEISHNRYNGTYLFSSPWNNLTGNEITQNEDVQLWIEFSENNTITGGRVSRGSSHCVYLYHSTFNNVSLLNITSCLNGIHSESSPHNSYNSNNISGSDFGMQLVSGSSNSTVLQSNISNNFIGIAVNYSWNNHVNNNSIVGNVFYAISAPSLTYLDAEYNYFGTGTSATTPTQIDKLVTDYVDYTPWLSFRESNVEYIDNYTEWTSSRSLDRGVIVNATGCLNITGASNSSLTITFNNIHGQNFIQVNNASNIKNANLQGANESFTLLYLDSTNGRIEHSNISGFRGLGIQSEEIFTLNPGIVVLNSDFYQSSHGVVLHRSRHTLIEESSFTSNRFWGIYIHSCAQINIGEDNNFSHNSHGLFLEESTNTSISGNDFYSNTLSGLSFEEFWPSTSVTELRNYSEDNDVADNTFLGNGIGTFLGNFSRLNDITENNFTSNKDGVYIVGSQQESTFYGNHTLALNEFFDNDYGVEIETSIYNNISKNSFVSNSNGIYVENSGPFWYPFSGFTNEITNNSILNSEEGERGIYVISSGRNFINNNSINSTFGGVRGTDTWGILLDTSSSNTLSSNLIQSNEYGIRLDSSGENNLTYNEMTNNFYNFGVTGSETDHFPQEVNTSNLVNSTKIRYWVGVNGGEVPSDAGYVGLINCANVTVPNATIHNNFQGILLVNTTNSTVQNVTVNWTYYGVDIFLSNNNTVKGYGSYKSVFEDNIVGVRLHRTDGSTIQNATVTRSNDDGIFISGTPSDPTEWNNVSRVYVDNCGSNGRGIRLDYSERFVVSNGTVDNCEFGIYVKNGGPGGYSYGTITFMNITNNGYGLRIVEYARNVSVTNNSIKSNDVGIAIVGNAQYNHIYHNNFTGNARHHGKDKNHDHVEWKNFWDNGYPPPQGGGNWWDGFSNDPLQCPDICSGENDGSGQKDPGSDGICDNWKIIWWASDNKDYYPLKYSPDVGPRS